VKTAPLEVALGALSFRQGDLKTAEACLKNAVKLDPKSSDAPLRAGEFICRAKGLETGGTALQDGGGSGLRPDLAKRCNTPSSKS